MRIFSPASRRRLTSIGSISIAGMFPPETTHIASDAAAQPRSPWRRAPHRVPFRPRCDHPARSKSETAVGPIRVSQACYNCRVPTIGNGASRITNMKCVTAFTLILLTAVAGFSQTANPFGFATGQSARLVIGQPEFDAESDTASQSIVGAVSGLAYANGMLFVADANLVGAAPVNNRVLLFPTAQFPAPNAALAYNTLCPVCGGLANVVLGQSDWTSTLPAPCVAPPTSR